MSPDLRVVLDTNVLVSAAFRPHSVPRQAYNLALAKGLLLLSEGALQEIREVLQRPKFDKYINLKQRAEFLAALVRDSEAVRVSETIRVCRDPKDDKFLELSIAGKATHLVTGDPDLLVLNPFRGVQIITPQQFVSTISALGGNGVK